ncbi:hypothetical protein BC826DRAFT_574963 [Russula brevipes]|nr:hypothetical protein BC826DRAFT_574963 [Russula brevipes]
MSPSSRRRITASFPRVYSELSSGPIPESCFWAHDFLLGASMVIIQPSSGKVVVVNDTESKTWFIPRGRKDIGESLEQCALREAYEESGYRVEFLPLYLPSRAPAPPSRPDSRRELLVCEPVFITAHEFGPYLRGDAIDQGGQYITFCYVGQIPANAVREEATGMPNESHYVGTLLELEEALRLLPPVEAHVTEVAHWHWRRTVEKVRRESDRRRRT